MTCDIPQILRGQTSYKLYGIFKYNMNHLPKDRLAALKELQKLSQELGLYDEMAPAEIYSRGAEWGLGESRKLREKLTIAKRALEEISEGCITRGSIWGDVVGVKEAVSKIAEQALKQLEEDC